MKRVTIAILLLLLLVAAPTGILWAAPHGQTRIIDVDDTVGDLVLFDDDLEVKEGAVVNGDVTLFNGDAVVDGEVKGDLVLFNGDLEAGETAVIGGDCVLMNGELDDETEEGLSCTNVAGVPNFIPALPDIPEPPRPMPDIGEMDAPRVHRPSGVASFFGNLAEAVVSGLLLGGLAFLTASLLPSQLNEVQNTMRRKPVASGTVGLLTAVAVPSLIALLSIISAILLLICIGILGFAVVVALGVALAAGLIFGWMVVGNWIGERLAEPLRLPQRLPVTAAVGTLLLTVVVGLLDVIPFIIGEGLISGLIACIGLGAVALTQFGTRPYPHNAPAAAKPVADEPDPDKVTAVLDTLPDDPSSLKENE
jgi:hypothetical protein